MLQYFAGMALQTGALVAQHRDTLFVTDTIRIAFSPGGIGLEAWIGIGLTAAGLAGGAAWKLLGLLAQTREVHHQINAEALSLRRELAAGVNGFERQPLLDAALDLQRGFDLEERRFERLTELAGKASRRVRRHLRRERQRFLDAAQLVNNALVGEFDDVNQDAIGAACAEINRCAEELSAVMELTAS
jgi:hypothetical protein